MAATAPDAGPPGPAVSDSSYSALQERTRTGAQRFRRLRGLVWTSVIVRRLRPIVAVTLMR